MKKQGELVRLKSVIDSDRLNFGDDFTELVLRDTEKVLSDYFDFNLPPEIAIEKERNGYKVYINFTATRIKNFVVLPK